MGQIVIQGTVIGLGGCIPKVNNCIVQIGQMSNTGAAAALIYSITAASNGEGWRIRHPPFRGIRPLAEHRGYRLHTQKRQSVFQSIMPSPRGRLSQWFSLFKIQCIYDLYWNGGSVFFWRNQILNSPSEECCLFRIFLFTIRAQQLYGSYMLSCPYVVFWTRTVAFLRNREKRDLLNG